MNVAPTPDQNQLIAALSEDVRRRLIPHLELVDLPLAKVLHESDELERFVYFPTDSLVSLLYMMSDGASAEISVVGREGIIGVAAFMGGGSSTSRAVVQSAGSAFRLPQQRLEDEFNRHGELQNLLLRYTQSLITQMAQTAVCNRHHTINQQLCRWLLMSMDRLSGDELNMTQELIANMLGVRREGRDRSRRQTAQARDYRIQARPHPRARSPRTRAFELRVLRRRRGRVPQTAA
jgi:CRP-like cAMP-binding protein